MPCEWGYGSPVQHPLDARNLLYLLGYRGFLDTSASLCCHVTVLREVWEKGRIEANLWSLVTFVVSPGAAHSRNTVKGLSGSSPERVSA